MIEMEVKNERDYPYMEVPESFLSTIYEMIEEIDLLLSIYKLKSSDVEYLEIKEKFGGLRVCFSFIPLFEQDELDGDDLLFYKTIDSMIYLLVDKAEKTIAYKIKKGFIKNEF